MENNPNNSAVKADNRSVLIVDDNATNRMLLADILGDSYNILEAEDGIDAIQLLTERASDIMLVLLDFVMPNMDGMEVLEIMNQRGWINDIPVIMISAETATTSLERAYDLGVTDYIMRPFQVPVVRRRVENTVALYSKQRRLIDKLSSQIYEKQKDTAMLVSILSHVVEFRNGESGLHILHIGTLVDILLRSLAQKTNRYNLTASRRALITTASALHDIGKISIPEAVLNKPGRLTSEEFELMKRHTIIGHEMLRDLPMTDANELIGFAMDICRWHHERYDGGGYPDGLKGDDIPIAAQVVALADVYDALASPRCYKKAYSHEQVMEMILSGKCGAFNPLLLECLVECGNEIRDDVMVLTQTQGNAGEFERFVAEIQDNEDLSVLSHTLELLETERQKYSFAREFSRELTFDYSLVSNILTLSPFTAAVLALPEIIQNPSEDGLMEAVFGEGVFADFVLEMADATLARPTVRMACNFYVAHQDAPVGAVFVGRAIFGAPRNGKQSMVGFVGKLVPSNPDDLLGADYPELTTPNHVWDTTGDAPPEKAAAQEQEATVPVVPALPSLAAIREMEFDLSEPEITLEDLE